MLNNEDKPDEEKKGLITRGLWGFVLKHPIPNPVSLNQENV